MTKKEDTSCATLVLLMGVPILLALLEIPPCYLGPFITFQEGQEYEEELEKYNKKSSAIRQLFVKRGANNRSERLGDESLPRNPNLLFVLCPSQM